MKLTRPIPTHHQRLSLEDELDLLLEGVEVHHVPVRHVDAPGHPLALRFKYGSDRLVAGLALLVLSPLLLAIALAVKLSSPGPVLYRQRRVGRNGACFDMFKFRSMWRGCDGGSRPSVFTAPGGVQGEDRRTRVGVLLRRTSLDELPQLLNVLRGEMSIIGPRPERPQFVQLFSDEVPGYATRHRMRVGITGLAQVRGLRGRTSLARRAAADNEYIDNWSPGMDMKVLALTVRAVLHHAE